ncbi:MAG: hypothetical protein HYX40_11550 [Sphingobacteriales bacterium]|nr:hypothetical protein [Sphingobacteriales bacterium]
MDTILNGTVEYDAVYIGNSRTHFGINPFYIDSITGFKSFNLGQGGSDAEEMLLYSALYLKSHKPPKFAVLTLDGSTVIKHNRLKDRYWNLFLLKNDTINMYMSKAGFNTTLIKYLPFLKYAYFDEYSRSSIFLKELYIPRFDHNLYNGFANTHQTITSDTTNWFKKQIFNPLDEKPADEKVNDTAVRNLKKIIALFKTSGTNVIIVYPPGIKSTDEKRINYGIAVDSVYSNMSKEFNIPIFDVNKRYSFPQKYFSDVSHLNEPGTRIFSRFIGQYLDSLSKK